MRPLFLAAAAALLCGPAAANDSTAEVAAGGLVLKRTHAIDMVSEDLFISADQVRVRYVFRNRTANDVRTIVAFPLPDRDFSQEWYGDVARPTEFRTRVAGREVAMQVERKALVRGADRTAELARLSVPVSGDYQAIAAALERLPAAERSRLVRLGLAQPEDGPTTKEDALAPAWTVKETWYWEQTFPAKAELGVEHSYTPGTGGSVGTPLVDKTFRRSAEGRSMIARYCADAAFLAGVDRLARAAGGDYPTVPERRVGYVLKTGANWASPIGRFRLVIDKGKAGNLVSFCAPAVRKISPTRFEMVRTNWRPERDLEILIVTPLPAIR